MLTWNKTETWYEATGREMDYVINRAKGRFVLIAYEKGDPSTTVEGKPTTLKACKERAEELDMKLGQMRREPVQSDHVVTATEPVPDLPLELVEHPSQKGTMEVPLPNVQNIPKNEEAVKTYVSDAIGSALTAVGSVVIPHVPCPPEMRDRLRARAEQPVTLTTIKPPQPPLRDTGMTTEGMEPVLQPYQVRRVKVLNVVSPQPVESGPYSTPNDCVVIDGPNGPEVRRVVPPRKDDPRHARLIFTAALSKQREMVSICRMARAKPKTNAFKADRPMKSHSESLADLAAPDVMSPPSPYLLRQPVAEGRVQCRSPYVYYDHDVSKTCDLCVNFMGHKPAEPTKPERKLRILTWDEKERHGLIQIKDKQGESNVYQMKILFDDMSIFTKLKSVKDGLMIATTPYTVVICSTPEGIKHVCRCPGYVKSKDCKHAGASLALASKYTM